MVGSGNERSSTGKENDGTWEVHEAPKKEIQVMLVVMVAAPGKENGRRQGQQSGKDNGDNSKKGSGSDGHGCEKQGRTQVGDPRQGADGSGGEISSSANGNGGASAWEDGLMRLSSTRSSGSLHS